MEKLDESSVFSLERFFSDYFTHLLTLECSQKILILLAQLCLLTWRECFILPSQRSLADILSNILVERIASDLSMWSFLSAKPTFASSEAFFRGIVFVSILRLIATALRGRLLPTNL